MLRYSETGLLLRSFFWLFAVLHTLNGAWMLSSPESWYEYIPAAVHDTGPLNDHFVRDIGLAYLISGIGFLYCALNLRRCRVVHMGNTLFIGGHAVLHVADIVNERLPWNHWLWDSWGVLVPGVIMLVLCVPPVWRRLNPYDLDT
jgi:hypothetical protein